MIAAVSYRNVCCYDPFKGFTRVIDFSKYPVSDVCFTNDGSILVVAAFKQLTGPGKFQETRHFKFLFHQGNFNSISDVFIYKVNCPKVIENGIVSNRHFRSHGTDPIICLCFTKADNFLITADLNGHIKIYKREDEFYFSYIRDLPFINEETIEEIKFSYDFVYFATLNSACTVSVWNGGSLTPTGINFKFDYANSFEWHPFVEDEFVVGTYEPPALYLCSITEKKVVAHYKNSDESVRLSSFCFKKQTGEIFASFFFKGKKLGFYLSILLVLLKVLPF